MLNPTDSRSFQKFEYDLETTSGLLIIIGEINDEFDQDDIIYNKIDSSTFVFEGKVNLTDLYRILKIRFVQVKNLLKFLSHL